MVEHSAVNRSVVGSSPTGGAHTARKCDVYGFYFILKFLRKLPDSVSYRVNPVMAWLDMVRIESIYFTQFLRIAAVSGQIESQSCQAH